MRLRRFTWEHRLDPSSPLVRTARSGTHNAFGGQLIVHPPAPVSVPSVTRLAPGFVGEGLQNLTGVWIGDDRGTYYIREVSETGEVAWVGEHPEARPDTLEAEGAHWVNVFMGQREGLTIRGAWTDVPKGEIHNVGELTLVATSENQLQIIRKTGGFGGTTFTRAENLDVLLRWVDLEIVDQQEWFFEGDEPYFFAMIALMDGTTVDLTDRSGAHADFSHSFVAPVLASNVGASHPPLSLASLPPTRLGIRPVHGDRPELHHPVLGIALRGAEHDYSNEPWQSDRLADWIATGGGELNRALQEGSVMFASDVGRWHEVVPFPWYDQDDTFGLDTIAFTRAGLLGMAGRTTRLTFNLRGSDVHYRVRADLTVNAVRGSCSP